MVDSYVKKHSLTLSDQCSGPQRAHHDPSAHSRHASSPNGPDCLL